MEQSAIGNITQPPSLICCQSVFVCTPGADAGVAEASWAKAGLLRKRNAPARHVARIAAIRLDVVRRVRVSLFIWAAFSVRPEPFRLEAILETEWSSQQVISLPARGRRVR